MNIYLYNSVPDAKRDEIIKRLCLDYAKELKLKEEIQNKLEDAVIKVTPNGKPYIAGIEDIHFSLSNSGSVWGCAIDRYPVGFDIEDLRRFRPNYYDDKNTNGYDREERWIKIAKRFFTEAEYDYVKRGGEDAFFQLWVCKEAYMKYKEIGLSIGLNSFELIKDRILINTLSDGWVEEISMMPHLKMAYCSARKRRIKKIKDRVNSI